MVWDKLSDGYLSEAKPDPKSPEARIQKFLASHPDSPEVIDVQIQWTGLEACIVTITSSSGEIKKSMARTAVFFNLPFHYHIKILVNGEELA